MTDRKRDDFPVDTFRDAAPHLRRPFTPAAVKFKVQATWPKDNPTGGLVVAYIDARLAVERLNLIVPHLWHDEYEPLGKQHLVCRLTIDGITRQDIGEGQGKGLYSDALKRAAVKFGIGVSLYAIPKMTINVNSGHAKPKRSRDGMTLEMTPAGEQMVRGIYEMWLERHGIRAFGEPLDHGDVADAAGDPEDAPTAAEPSPAPRVEPDPSSPPLASPQERAAIKARADERNVPPTELAMTLVRAAGGDESKYAFDSQAAATAWVDKALERLPKAYVKAVLTELDAALI